MIYKVGTVSIANKSELAAVSGGALSPDNCRPGMVVMIDGFLAMKEVEAVNYDTQEITLASPWQGPTVMDAGYQIVGGFTPHHGFPEIAPGTKNWHALYNASLRQLDALLHTSCPVIVGSGPPPEDPEGLPLHTIYISTVGGE